jgi:hypothetical protein
MKNTKSALILGLESCYYSARLASSTLSASTEHCRGFEGQHASQHEPGKEISAYSRALSRNYLIGASADLILVFPAPNESISRSLNAVSSDHNFG